MKKKIRIVILIIVIIAGYSAYKYVFKGPRDVSAETAAYVTTANLLKSDFASNQTVANAKYLGKTIIISGKVTEKTKESITLNNGVVCVLSSTANNNIKLNTDVKIKGKVDGFDDLFEQVKLTESSVLN
ncbi:MAG: OB-fold putative lipoprotein [Flavobacteriaceae bacterium]|nr:OB-fold putative lipoprotein [Flavobacteriaceae bacterium]